MSKKKPATKKAESPSEFSIREAIRESCRDVVKDLYVEVEKVAGIRLDALRMRCDELTERLGGVEGQSACFASIDRRLDSLNVDFCALADRVAEIERRLHRRKWLCLPWCR